MKVQDDRDVSVDGAGANVWSESDVINLEIVFLFCGVIIGFLLAWILFCCWSVFAR